MPTAKYDYFRCDNHTISWWSRLFKNGGGGPTLFHFKFNTFKKHLFTGVYSSRMIQTLNQYI